MVDKEENRLNEESVTVTQRGVWQYLFNPPS